MKHNHLEKVVALVEGNRDIKSNPFFTCQLRENIATSILGPISHLFCHISVVQ